MVFGVVPKLAPSIKIVAPFGFELTIMDPVSGANETDMEWSELTFVKLGPGVTGVTAPSIVNISI